MKHSDLKPGGYFNTSIRYEIGSYVRVTWKDQAVVVTVVGYGDVGSDHLVRYKSGCERLVSTNWLVPISPLEQLAMCAEE